MGDDKGRSALHEPAERILNLHFGSGVDGRGCLIEYEHRRMRQHDARNAEELLLPLRKISAGFAYHGIIAVRKPFDKIVGVGCRGGGDYLIFACIGPAHCDVFTDGALLQPGFLQNHAELSAQLTPGHGLGVCSVHQYPAADGVIKAHEQIYERCLAAAGRADDSDELSGLYPEAEIPYQGLIRGI